MRAAASLNVLQNIRGNNMESIKGQRTKKILKGALSLILIITVTIFMVIPSNSIFGIAALTIGAALVLSCLVVAGITAVASNKKVNPCEEIYKAIVDFVDDPKIKRSAENIYGNPESFYGEKQKTVDIPTTELIEITEEVTEFIESKTIFDTETGKYIMSLDGETTNVIELTYNDLIVNGIANMNNLDLVKGKFSFDYNSITSEKFNALPSNAFGNM